MARLTPAQSEGTAASYRALIARRDERSQYLQAGSTSKGLWNKREAKRVRQQAATVRTLEYDDDGWLVI